MCTAHGSISATIQRFLSFSTSWKGPEH
uniref:Uncharacterized protein n=1 Tax=Rhizophora mucronata TaxID=61149 RepID=A0A2P2NL61_RHIMU